MVNNNVDIPTDYSFEKTKVLKQNNSILNNEDVPVIIENFEYKSFEKTEPETVEVVTVTSETKEEKKDMLSQSELQLTLSDEINEYNIVGQIFNTYIIVEYSDTILLIDQHAAHERINTNKLLKELENSKVISQPLLFPCVLQLSAEDFLATMDNLQLFLELGFEIEEFGVNTIRINAVPNIFGEKNVKTFFYDSLDNLKKNTKIETRKSILFDTACKHSIRAGQRLTNNEIKELIKMSMEDKTPLNCPHGRPIVIIKTKKEIEKWFMRIV